MNQAANQAASNTRGIIVVAGVLVGALTLFGCASDGAKPNSGSAGAGATGSAGTTGTAGTTGSAGTTGVAGTTGAAGTAGAPGNAGTTGTAGTGAAANTTATGAAGATNDGGAGVAGPDAGANADAGAFTLMSPTLKIVDGGLVFPASASAPMNQSPELEWSGAPAGRLSFALTIYDATAKNTHFILSDIKPDEIMLMANLPRGAMPTVPAGASWKSAFGGTPGYEGPGGGGINNYEIVLWALKVSKLDLGTMTLNQIHATLLPAQSLGSAQLLAKGTRNGL
jgi:phosphatidylethanolamine-binding protein (PEBP) family uncharacterized protein